MPKTNAVINMKDINGKKLTKSITDISNDATNQQILDFAQGIVGVTNNYYDYTNKVTTTKIDSEDDKQNPVLKLIDALGQDASTVRENTTFELAYTGNSTVYFTMLPATSTGTIELNATTEGGGIYKRVFRFTKGTSTKFALFSPETTAYNEAYIEYNFA